jgi:hypothetical protein
MPIAVTIFLVLMSMRQPLQKMVEDDIGFSSVPHPSPRASLHSVTAYYAVACLASRRVTVYTDYVTVGRPRENNAIILTKKHFLPSLTEVQ